MLDLLRILPFAAAGLVLGYLAGRMLAGGRVRLSPVLRVGLILLGGALGVYLSQATAAPGRTDPDSLRTPVTVLATEQQFDQVVAQAVAPVLIDFYADWCPPCRYLSPILEELHTTWGTKVSFYKVNVDHSPALARRFQIESIPTFVLLRQGRESQRIMGAPPRGELERLLARAAEASPERP